jgi:hypothetical protein
MTRSKKLRKKKTKKIVASKSVVLPTTHEIRNRKHARNAYLTSEIEKIKADLITNLKKK